MKLHYYNENWRKEGESLYFKERRGERKPGRPRITRKMGLLRSFRQEKEEASTVFARKGPLSRKRKERQYLEKEKS